VDRGSISFGSHSLPRHLEVEELGPLIYSTKERSEKLDKCAPEVNKLSKQIFNYLPQFN
jgi:hypothetical protein